VQEVAGVSTEYWDDRSKGTFYYKGEQFYTVTPIPYYVRRRAWLIHRLREALQGLECTPRRVLDFGCGDGYYTRLLKSWLPDAEIVGYDPSVGMIGIDEVASKVEDMTLTASKHDVESRGPFDVVVCVAVLAHISDDVIEGELAFWRSVLASDGTVLVFEQVADQQSGGATWTRRIPDSYRSLLRAHQMPVRQEQSYCRPLFDRLSFFVMAGYGGMNRLLRRQSRNPNQSALVRLAYEICEMATRHLDARMTGSRRNTLFVAGR